ncbi:MAG: polyprenyl synthetase family protein [Xanthobacteraceae bacterium]
MSGNANRTANAMNSFERRLAEQASHCEQVLEETLSASPQPGERARPARLLAAMRHAVLGGGKRLRPILVVESAALFGVSAAASMLAGAAFELLHCYSLVHDDLPAMDDDDLRRGKPTLHKAFDEATAILAGDALQTLAFDVLSREAVHDDPAVRASLVQCLARASGIGGMAGGQMLDLEAEGRFSTNNTPAALDIGEIETLQRMKTGALLAACCEAGAILGRAPETEKTAIMRYARAIGFAFQLADDILDVEGDAAAVGKAVGKDAAKNKGTLVAAIGVPAARKRLVQLIDEAKDALAPFGARAEWLIACGEFIAARKS